MAVVITGDFARLQAAIAQTQRLASPAFLDAVKADLGEAARTEIVLGFAQSRDPYGDRWDPLRAKTGRRVGGQPLRDTARLQNSYNAQPTAQGFEVRSGVGYGGYHQRGTRRMVARRMVPDRADDIGPYWRRTFIRVLERHITRATRR